MRLTIRYAADEAQSVRDALLGFATQELGVVPEQRVEAPDDRWRNTATDTIVLVCTVLQGAGAALYLAKELDAKRTVTDFLGRLRRAAKPDGTISAEVDDGKPFKLTGAKPERVLKALGYEPPDPK